MSEEKTTKEYSAEFKLDMITKICIDKETTDTHKLIAIMTILLKATKI